MQNREPLKNTHLSELQRTRFRHWLQKQFADRCQKNPRYSLRAFSSYLDLDPSTISQYFSGKRAPSKKALLHICTKLSTTANDLRLLGFTSEEDPSNQFHPLSEDTMSVLAHWCHFAILELTYVQGFKSEPKWIANQLGISVIETRAAIERLLRLGLLKNDNGVLKKTYESITNHTGINTSAARKSLQKDVIAKALTAIDEVPQEEKDISSITMAINPENMDKARELIKNFRRELCALVETGTQTQVYNLAVQLYPVSKKRI